MKSNCGLSAVWQAVAPVLAVHGGAGSAEWEHMDAQAANAYRNGLARALSAAVAKLRSGAAAIDAVEAGIVVLEDDPLFNAGRGSGFNAEGKNEMDASIMDGATLAAGAVAGAAEVLRGDCSAAAIASALSSVELGCEARWAGSAALGAAG